MQRLDGTPPELALFTTGQVARVLGCTALTATKAIDGGHIPGFRLPGSQDRRVARADLIHAIGDRPDLAECLDRIREIERGKAAGRPRKRGGAVVISGTNGSLHHAS